MPYTTVAEEFGLSFKCKLALLLLLLLIIFRDKQFQDFLVFRNAFDCISKVQQPSTNVALPRPHSLSKLPIYSAVGNRTRTSDAGTKTCLVQ